MSGFGSLRDRTSLGNFESPLNLPARIPCNNVGHSEFVVEISDGFEALYRFFAENKFWLKSLVTKLFRKASFRVVNRGTRIYDALIRNATKPISLQQQPPTFERLDSSVSGDNAYSARITTDEKRSLKNGEIPLFRMDALSKNLSERKNVIAPNFASLSPIENAHRGIDELSEFKLSYQKTLIRSSFAAIGYRLDSPTANSKAEDVVRDFTELDYLQEVTEICRNLRRHMIADELGHPNWLGFQLIPGTHAVRPRELNFSLYDGLGGPMLLLSAYEFVSGKTDYRDIVELIVRKLEHATAPLTDSNSIGFSAHLGGLAGIPSIIYSLEMVYQLIGLERAASVASRVANLLSPSMVFSDTRLDFLGGTAGLLAVLGSSRLNGNVDLIDAAVEHLVDSQHKSGGWVTIPDTPPLVGFAHGTSGILLQLARHGRPSSKLQDALKNGLRYESQIYDSKMKNWPDLRIASKNKFKNNWCHGAPGTLLARHSMQNHLAKHGLEPRQCEVGDEVDSLRKPHYCDHICCGNFGISQILSALGQFDTAKKRISYAIERKRKAGSFHLGMDSSDKIFNAGMFLGLSGIAYSLLRHIDQSLPCLLTLNGLESLKNQKMTTQQIASLASCGDPVSVDTRLFVNLLTLCGAFSRTALVRYSRVLWIRTGL